MKFVICKDEDYEKNYAARHHMYVRLKEVMQLLGYAGVGVLIHIDNEYPSSTLSLIHDVELLGDFGYCKVVYVESTGMEEQREAKIDSTLP